MPSRPTTLLRHKSRFGKERSSTIRLFLEVNLDLTAPLPRFSFYDESRRIFTQARFLAGSKMPDRHLGQSVIAEGSLINGSDIRDSVIGVRSRIGYETTVNRPM